MMCGVLAPHAVVVTQTFTGRVSESPTDPTVPLMAEFHCRSTGLARRRFITRRRVNPDEDAP